MSKARGAGVAKTVTPVRGNDHFECRGCHGRFGHLSTAEQSDKVHEFCRHIVYGKRQPRPHAGMPGYVSGGGC